MLLRLVVIFAHVFLSHEVYVIARVQPSMLFPSLEMNYENNDVIKTAFVTSENSDENDVDNVFFEQKRNAGSSVSLPKAESVCETKIIYDFKPKEGYDENGVPVEIQQDAERSFVSNFVECDTGVRTKCYGINESLFTSDCYTHYVFRPASIRPVGSTENFRDGKIKVPITCECRVRRVVNRP